MAASVPGLARRERRRPIATRSACRSGTLPTGTVRRLAEPAGSSTSGSLTTDVLDTNLRGSTRDGKCKVLPCYWEAERNLDPRLASRVCASDGQAGVRVRSETAGYIMYIDLSLYIYIERERKIDR